MKQRLLSAAAVAVAAVAASIAILGVATSSATLIVALSMVALVALGLLAMIAVPWGRASRGAANARATRIANLERRVVVLAERAEAVERDTAARRKLLEAEVVQLRDQLSSGASGDRSGSWEAPAAQQFTDSLVAVGRKHDLQLRDFLSRDQAVAQVRTLAEQRREIDSLPYLDAFPDLISDLNLSTARGLLKALRRLGYLSYAIPIIESIAERFGNEADSVAAALYKSELALYRGEVDLNVDLPPLPGPREQNVVLHFVGKALPETQSGYTLRTQYTVEAQRRLGITPVVVAQAGASDRSQERTETYQHEGVTYYLLAGPQRGSVPWDQWLSANVEALAEVVRQVRPTVIHTHSDFINAMIALPVAKAYEIPLVNETRGFWEESWLSRTAHAEGWHDLSALEERYGLPEMYELRVEREAQTRSESSAVVTLARVMRNHIDTVARELQLPAPPTSTAPNAVHAAEFPVLPANEALRDELGIEPGSIVLGYISSIVEYEGIDTLVRAAYELEVAIDAARQFAAEAIREPSAPDESMSVAVDHEVPSISSPLLALHESVAATSRVFGAIHDPTSVPPSEAASDERVAAMTPIMTELVERLRRVHPDAAEPTLTEYAEHLVAAAQPLVGTPVRLLIVGQGAELPGLRTLVEELGVRGALFTGRVPHQHIVDYYGLIDLFVVPRKRSAVTELVTPLKPFEALSTGRPCVFSDVAALSEIAGDTGCVELFRAGDHHDLAMTAARLLSDPERLAQMSREGAEWVRNERSWDMNALTYLELYRSLGFTLEAPEASTELLALRNDGVGAQTILQRLAKGPAPDPTGWFLLEVKRYTAARIMTEGWKLAKLPAVSFEPGLDWEAPGKENRSWGFHLHAWEFLDPALQEYATSGDETLLRWMLDVALDWWRAVDGVPADETMAWYDMSLSLRMPRLARLMVAISKSSFADQTVRLIRPALEHIRQSMLDAAFNAGNNHGFFAAAAAIDFARWLEPLPGSAALRDLGHDRMRTMLAKQFGADGGHLEHSPDYHRMLLRSFESALKEGLVDDGDTALRIRLAARVLGWLVQPDGALVQFGDSPRFDVQANGLTSIDDQTTFIITDGASGKPETEELLVLPDAGYAIVRSPQPMALGERIQSSYLALQAGFHSRAHKHADDLTFTWFDRGQEILVDAGRFGYIDLLPTDSPDRLKGFYYSAPERQYVESTIAHNTVGVNDLDIERRKRTPYGSALRSCERADGKFTLRGTVDHANYQHERELVLTPHRRLEIVDVITPSEEPVDAIAWFNMPGDADVQVDGESLVVALGGSPVTLRVTSSGSLVTPVRGQTSPMRGWRSILDRELAPAWSFGFRTTANDATELRTVFIFQD